MKDDRTATLTCEDGNGDTVYRKAVPLSTAGGEAVFRRQHDLAAERVLRKGLPELFFWLAYLTPEPRP